MVDVLPQARHALGSSGPYLQGVEISTLECYASKAHRQKPLEPGKAPGKRFKMSERLSKLLQEDLKENGDVHHP